MSTAKKTNKGKDVMPDGTHLQPGEDLPVLSWRVGQLENSQKEGFKVLNQKLDELVRNFATKEELANLRQQASLEHQALQRNINDTRTDLEEKIKTVKDGQLVKNVLTIALTALVTFLITYFLNSINHKIL